MARRVQSWRWHFLSAVFPVRVAAVLAAVASAGAALAAAGAAETASAAPPLAELLARHLAWLGGPAALDSLRDLSMTGRLEVAGLAGTFRSQQHRAGWSRGEYDLGALRGAQGLGQDGGWALNASGQLEPLGDEQERALRRATARSFGAHLRGADGSAIQDLGWEEQDGRRWRVVRFSYPDGDRWDLFLDPEDGSLTWVREQRDTEVLWHRLEDWRLVDGVRFACREAELHANPASDQLLAVQAIETNRGLTADVFAAPGAGRKLQAFADGATATDWLPITLHRGAYLFVPGTVNGVPTEMVLDCGAGMTVLDRAFADSLGLQGAGAIAARGAAGESEARLVQGLAVQLGELRLAEITAAVVDLADIGARLGRPLAVILGKEVFQALVVDIDYPAARLRLLDPGGFAYEGPGRRLPVFPAQDGHAEVEVSVEHLPPARVALDTGSGAALDLFGAYVEENRLLDGRAGVSAALVVGVGGTCEQKVTSLDSLRIAGYRLARVPVGIHQAEVGAFHTRRVAGNLGSGLLRRFRVICDYAHGCLWLEPGPGWDSLPFERNRCGLQTVRQDGALEVVFVAPGSPAREAGWQVGERIVAVDGVPVGTTYVEAIDCFANGPAGRVLGLTLADGSERTLTLRDYY